MTHEHDQELERTVRNVRDLVDKLERDQLGWRDEKRLLKLLGVILFAVVGFLGIAYMLRGTKEKDVERLRCEMEQQVALVWKETEAMKAQHPDMDAKQVQAAVEAKRPAFKEAAKAACTGR